MATKNISLEFDGYWRETNKSGIPAESGIYCVYVCTHNKEETLSIRRLIYIGESQDVNSRISNHEKLKDWGNYLKNGEIICYSLCKVGTIDRERAEAALIFKHKPPVNTEYTDAFPFDTTTITLSGKHKFLDSSFTTTRKE